MRARCTLILEFGETLEQLVTRLNLARDWPVLVVCSAAEHEELVQGLAATHPEVPVIPMAGPWPTSPQNPLLPLITTPYLAYLPAELPFAAPPLQRMRPGALVPQVAPISFPTDESQPHEWFARGWCADTRLLREPDRLGRSFLWDPLSIGRANQDSGLACHWLSWQLEGTGADLEVSGKTCLQQNSGIAALVPHFRGEQWLRGCLESLVQQSRPLDAIYVIDDASPQPPLAIVEAFPQVTLLQARENSGPYRLVQEVIRRTSFDGYLFQDADDWSALDRLELLLAGAVRSGAGLIGGQEFRLLLGGTDEIPREMAPNGLILPYLFPLDVNSAHQRVPAYALHHPTSLLSRDLWEKTGGFATGLRFGADTEFQLRASFCGRVINLPDFLYYRRIHPASLTEDPQTGYTSPARQALRKRITARARANMAACRNGGSPDLTPLELAPPLELNHLCGPLPWRNGT